MTKFYVEVDIEDVPKLIDVVCDFDGFAAIMAPVFGQYCTRDIEVELSEDLVKEFYAEIKLRGIRNYQKEAT